jgi:regulator of replication initiation timing
MRSFPYFIFIFSIFILSACGAKKSDLRALNDDIVNLTTEVQVGTEKIISLEANNQTLSQVNSAQQFEIDALKKELGEIKAIAEEVFRRSRLPDGAGAGQFAVHLASYRDEK